MAHASALPHFASGSFVSSCSPSSTGASAGRRLALLASLVLVGCSSGGGSVDPSGAVTTTQAELQRVEFGRLVDVYGLQNSASGSTIELFRRDVLIGSNIRDERSSSYNLTDAEITYDFLGADPDSLHPRLFIPRELGSPAFQTAFDGSTISCARWRRWCSAAAGRAIRSGSCLATPASGSRSRGPFSTAFSNLFEGMNCCLEKNCSCMFSFRTTHNKRKAKITTICTCSLSHHIVDPKAYTLFR